MRIKFITNIMFKMYARTVKPVVRQYFIYPRVNKNRTTIISINTYQNLYFIMEISSVRVPTLNSR